MKVATATIDWFAEDRQDIRVSEPFPSNEGRYIINSFKIKHGNPKMGVSEPFPSNEGRYSNY